MGTTNIYIGNEHSYTIKRENAKCFKVYIHNRYTTDEHLIAEAKSFAEADEIIKNRLKTNRNRNYVVATSRPKNKRKRCSKL